MKRPAAFVLAVMLSAARPAGGAESWWPQFRGPNGSGVSESARPPVEFAPGTNQLWKTPVPAGASSPCIWRDRIFLTAFENGRLLTLCYERSDGALRWKRDARAEAIEEFHPEEGSPAASTPATDGKRVVTYFGSCGLICYDMKGKEESGRQEQRRRHHGRGSQGRRFWGLFPGVRCERGWQDYAGGY
jgi:hypothetical protein